MKKKQNKKKKNVFLIRKIVAVIVIIILCFLIRNLSYNFSQKKQMEIVRLMLNNEIVEMTNKIYVEDSIIYISEDDIKNIFDKTIYYNVGDEELITTYNKHVAVLHLNQNSVMINDSKSSIQGQLKEIDGSIYLPITDLSIVYDLEIEYSQATNMVIMNSTTKSKEQVIVVKNTNLKKTKGIFALTVEKLKRGDYLYIIEEDGNHFKVRNSNGNIGYVKKSKVSEKEVIRENLSEEDIEINIVEENADITKGYDGIGIKSDEVNASIIKDFVFEKDNSVISKIDVNSNEYKNYCNTMDNKNIEIFAKFENLASVSNAFSTYEKRNVIINELYNKLIENQYKGVCIDFQEIDDVNSFYRFLIELTPKFKESGLRVVVKINNLLDKEKVKNIVDDII